jgi:hypothetical protein
MGERKMGEERQYSYKPEGGSLPEDFGELYAAVSSKMLEKWEEKVQKKESEKRSAITPETFASTSVEPYHPLPNISIDKVGRGGMEFEEDLEAPICQAEPELPVELPAAEVPVAKPPIANLVPWFQRKLGEWIKCRVVEFVGGRYLLEAKSMVDSGMVRFRAYPEDLRWEAPT